MPDRGTVLSQRYELLTFLGKGGMSEVWKARHIHLDKFVAVKLLHKELTERQEFLARFKQEAQISSKLSHPNICGVSDFGFTEDNIPFIVMEYLEGESLAAVLKRIERLPVGASLSITRQTIAGLSAAHRIGVVHRDIKPGNIFIGRERTGARIVKVLDFGISKLLSGKKGDLGLTTTGTLLGTAFYLSPEQIMESRCVDQRTDLYAAGTVLYKLITGKVPYMGENFGEVAVKVVNGPLVDPRELVEGLSGRVARIIRKAMEKDPRERYQDAEAFVSDLDKALEEYQGDTIEALYKPGLENLILKPSEYAPSRYSRKTKIAALGTSILLLLGAGLLVAFFLLNNAPGSARGQAMAPGKAAAGKTQKHDPGEPGGTVTGSVKIRLKNIPSGAVIRLGENEYTGDLVEVPRSKAPLKIIISDEGFQDKEITFVPNSDLDLDASLEPVPEGDEAAAKAQGKPRSGKGKKSAGKQPDGQTPPPEGKTKTQKKGGGMDFVREFPGEE
jgi:serine/threonine protein kinase